MKKTLLFIYRFINNIKIGKKLTIGFSIILFLLLVLGTISSLSIDDANTASNEQALYQSTVSIIRNGRMHLIAYRFDKAKYRPGIIMDQLSIVRNKIDSLRSYLPESELANLDSAYTDAVLITKSSENYLANSKKYKTSIQENLKHINLFAKNFHFSSNENDSVLMKIENKMIFLLVEFTKFNLHPGNGNLKKSQRELDYLIKHVPTYISPTDIGIMEPLNDIHVNLIQFEEVLIKERAIYRDINKITPRLVDRILALSRKRANDNTKELTDNKFTIYIIIGVALLLVVVLARLLTFSIVSGLKNIVNASNLIAKGNLESYLQKESLARKDEVGEISKTINELINNLKLTAEFAEQTGKGNFELKYKLLGEADVLGLSLVQMQDSLSEAQKEQEQTKERDRKEKFINTGLNEFNKIASSVNNNFEVICYSIVKNIVDYMQIPMGALYIHKNDADKDEDCLELMAAIAYDREKCMSKTILIGEGLVGRCAYEKLPIYMTDIPNNYMKITSGLGDSNPNNLFLVPLILEDTVYGVIELASFEVIEDYKRIFIEKLAENIASILSNIENNKRNLFLLEQSKMQSEELAAQEEELRQNMEELQATQEAAERKEIEQSQMVNIYNESMFTTSYTLEGTILEMNKHYLTFLNIDSANIVDQNYTKEYNHLGIDNFDFAEIANDIKYNRTASKKHTVNYQGEAFIISEQFHGLYNHDNSALESIIKISCSINSTNNN